MADSGDMAEVLDMAEAARQLAAVVEAVESGHVTASRGQRERLRGALAVLRGLAHIADARAEAGTRGQD
jgi:hypothetical protein